MSRKRAQRKREQARRARPAPSPPRAPTSVARAASADMQQMAAAVCAEVQAAVSRCLAPPSPGAQGHTAGADSIDEGSGTQRQAQPSDSAACIPQLADAARNVALRVIQQSPQAAQHACQAGCAFCCHTAVTVAPPEAMTILQHLRARCSLDELAGVRARIETNAKLAASMSRQDYTARSIRCALLTDDGNCRAHAVHPLACAGFVSTSRAACEAEFRRVVGRAPVPIDRVAMLAGLSASYGLKGACAEAGVDGEFYELHHALSRIWDMPDAASHWVAGAPIFDGCLRADAW